MHVEESSTPVAIKKSNRKYKLAIALALLVLIPVIGTVFAANIGINTGTNKIQFGQGAAATLACDSDFTMTPFAGFTNDTNTAATGTWNLESITVTNLDTSSTGCYNVTIILKAIKSDGTEQTVASGCSTASNTSMTVVFTNGVPAVATGCNFTITGTDRTTQATSSFNIVLASGYRPASTNVDKITVLSS